MKPTAIKIRKRKSGGHIDLTFWTGVVGFTFANIGTLTMTEDDSKMLLDILGRSSQVVEIKEENYEG
jgi:hypothetical protein